MRNTTFSILRNALRKRKLPVSSSSLFDKTLIPPSSPSSLILNKQIHTKNSVFNFNGDCNRTSYVANAQFLLHHRAFSTSSGPSNIVYVKSEEDFNNAVGKAQDESIPSIFYYTAVWCGPCRLLSPVIEQLSEKFPSVSIYKIDIDQNGIERMLMEQNINSVPTLQFYKNGKKESQVVGADLERIKQTVEKLYQ